MRIVVAMSQEAYTKYSSDLEEEGLLLIDEASLGLAPNLTHQVFEAVRRIGAEGVTVLMVEQNAGAAPFADGEWIGRTGTGTIEVLIPREDTYVIFLNLDNFAGTILVNPERE